jgi:uncharacterized protein
VPLHIVIDTNVYVSATVFGGVPRKAIEKAYAYCTVLCSDYIITELQDVLRSKKFAWSQSHITSVCDFLFSDAVMIRPDEIISVSRDSKDDPVLACAVAGNADVLITGDKDLLVLRRYKDTRILTPTSWLASINHRQ